MPLNRADAIAEMVTVMVPALSGIPTVWPNKTEDAIDKSGTWVRVTFRHGESSRATLGVRRERHQGFVFVQFFFRVGTGSDDVYTVPQAMLDALTDCRTRGGVWFRNVSLFEGGFGAEIGEEETDAYFPVTVQAQFTYDEIRD